MSSGYLVHVLTQLVEAMAEAWKRAAIEELQAAGLIPYPNEEPPNNDDRGRVAFINVDYAEIEAHILDHYGMDSGFEPGYDYADFALDRSSTLRSMIGNMAYKAEYRLHRERQEWELPPKTNGRWNPRDKGYHQRERHMPRRIGRWCK